ncbi:MAG: sterol desaturase family protein [bacterium]
MSPEAPIRLSVFFAVLLGMMIWERFAPRRAAQRRALRWPGNLGVGALNALLLALAPLSAVGAALFSIFNQFGLLLWLQLPLWPSIIISLLLLDLAVYWQHRLFHAIPMAWKFHRMHHTDTEFDATTALRFHPLEIVVSMLIKAAVIVLLGAPVLAAIAFEIILNAAAMFNHGNVKLPRLADRALRWLVVTPDMHRVHHAVHADEYNRNYGFSLSLWDRLFGSYAAQPRDGHAAMQIGQRNYRARDEARLDRLLTQPFR